MKNNLTKTEEAKAQRYREYLLGWAYIPLQDLPLYESAYKKWSHQSKGWLSFLSIQIITNENLHDQFLPSHTINNLTEIKTRSIQIPANLNAIYTHDQPQSSPSFNLTEIKFISSYLLLRVQDYCSGS